MLSFGKLALLAFCGVLVSRLLHIWVENSLRSRVVQVLVLGDKYALEEIQEIWSGNLASSKAKMKELFKLNLADY